MLVQHLYAFFGVFIVSLVSLAGIFTISIREEVIKKYIFILVSLAVGALLGDAFIHLIPEAFEGASNPELISLSIIGGILLFFIMEKFLHWHHHDDDTDEVHVHPVGKLVLFSDGVHNFLDGIIIGTSFMVDTSLGVATTLAVILHEIPQEVGDFAVLLHAGYSRKRALWLNFLSALSAVLGTLVAFLVGGVGDSFSQIVLPIASGGFIYIAVADLIPELHKTKLAKDSILQILALCVGVLLMFLLLFLE